MEKNSNPEVMQLLRLKNYIGEWLIEPKTTTITAEDGSITYQIRDNYDKTLFYSQPFEKGTYEDEEQSNGSTKFIMHGELRMLVEQCVRLDKQIDSYKKSENAGSQAQPNNN